MIGILLKYRSSVLNKTTHLVYRRLQQVNEEYQKLSDEAMTGTLNEPKRRRLNALSPKVHIYNSIAASFSVIQDAQQMQASGLPAEDQKFFNEEIAVQELSIKEQAELALTHLIEKDEYDDVTQITVEVRGGVGGSESSLFAEDLMGMFQSYAAHKSWDCRVLVQQKDTQIGKGCKLGVLAISGEDSYYRLKCESGVHKVIRVPETESKGRLHSSTASVVVLPKVDEVFVLKESEIRVEFMKASGPGGQHVNKTESACRVTHIPTGIQVANMEDRSQDRNKQRALQILRDKLFAIHVQEKQDRLASRRRSQVQGSDRSDKIRTYNFPQERITDHRTGITLYGMDKMLQGSHLDEFIDRYLEKIYNTKLEDLMEELQQ